MASLMALVFALSACGGDDEPQQASAPSTSTEATTSESPTSTESTETAERTETEASKPDDQKTDTTPADSGQATGSAPPANQGNPSGGFAPANAAERERVSTTVGDFYDALANQEGGTACGLLTTDVADQLTKQLSSVPQFQGKDCGEIMDVVTKNYPEQLRTRLRDLQVTKVTVNGDRAIASYTGRGLQASRTTLVREDGSWRVSVFGGVPALRG